MTYKVWAITVVPQALDSSIVTQIAFKIYSSKLSKKVMDTIENFLLSSVRKTFDRKSKNTGSGLHDRDQKNNRDPFLVVWNSLVNFEKKKIYILFFFITDLFQYKRSIFMGKI